MITLPEHLEKPFLQIAESEHKSASTLLAQLVTEYLEDYHDLQLAKQAMKRIDDGAELLDWEDVKAGLYDVED